MLTVTLDGAAHRLKSGDALFVPRGTGHRFDNLDAGDARALVTLTPAVAGKRYFEDIAAVVNAGGAARHGEGESGHGQIRADRSVSGYWLG